MIGFDNFEKVRSVQSLLIAKYCLVSESISYHALCSLLANWPYIF